MSKIAKTIEYEGETLTYRREMFNRRLRHGPIQSAVMFSEPRITALSCLGLVALLVAMATNTVESLIVGLSISALSLGLMFFAPPPSYRSKKLLREPDQGDGSSTPPEQS